MAQLRLTVDLDASNDDEVHSIADDLMAWLHQRLEFHGFGPDESLVASTIYQTSGRMLAS